MKLLNILLLFSTIFLTSCKNESNLTSRQDISSPESISTKEDRKALFDYIITKTQEREAFSPIKESKLGFSPIENMKACEQEFVNASSEEELWYALQKLSNARKDRHLSIDKVSKGIKPPEVSKGRAPIVFYPDFSSLEKTVFFVSDVEENNNKVQIGDELVEINGASLDEYIKWVEPYMRYSTTNNFLVRLADRIGKKDNSLPRSFYKDKLYLKLKNRKGQLYEAVLPYKKEVNLKYGRFIRNYKGYKLAWKAKSFWVYAPKDPKNKTLLLWWYGFRGDLKEASDKLVDYAKQNNMLDYDIIIDAINSRGGSQGAYAIARLTSKPFKTTGGNIRLSDIADDFRDGIIKRYDEKKIQMDHDVKETEDDGSYLYNWMKGPVTKELDAGKKYTTNVPFKCAHLPHTNTDWIMQPASIHFTGKMVVFFGPWGGSHLSQFAAMIKDNNLGYTMGMPDGGYSNTWEWHEDLIFPISKKPVAEFMWDIGHTIRPNNEILEGNPIQVDEYIPITKDNYLEYKNILLKKAQEYLEK
ncbi:hypothetical protein U6A24_06490 [Aquimarina gracilis]|uniref:Peptidase S41-like protein n=1 Tax=Aquimarina gracilis TaxID=874422 RepID=A0ABU5ZSV9_9FLAO|nr:hypothetical protein [Aquimarina gracilis]MEB3345100.1 hypothetical protein [Aquimarina gracilis]